MRSHLLFLLLVALVLVVAQPPSEARAEGAVVEDGDAARLRSSACRAATAKRVHHIFETLAAKFLERHQRDDFASDLIWQNFHLPECKNIPLWRELKKGRWDVPEPGVEPYDTLVRSPGFRSAVAKGYVACRLPLEPEGSEMAANHVLTGPCAIPRAWAERGITRDTLCLDRRVYAYLLALWTHAGGDDAVEEFFVTAVRAESRRAWEKDYSEKDRAGCVPPT